MNDLAFDCIVMIAGITVAALGMVIPSSIGYVPVLVLIGLVFAVTGAVWLAQDLRYWFKYRRPLKWPAIDDTQPF